MIDLVTGGAGFLGRHLVEALRRERRQVRVLDVRDAPDLPEDVEVIQGSVTDADVAARAVAGVRRVFHLAAIPELWIRDKARFDQVNHLGTRTLLDALRGRHDLETFVHTSSEVVLVARPGVAQPARLDETVDLAPAQLIGPYARSKRRAELAVLAAAEAGLPAMVVIPTMPLGPGDVSRTPPTRMIDDLRCGRTPAYADVLLNAVDVRDAAQGHLLVAEHGARGERYLLSGHNVTMGALLGELSAFVDRPLPHRRVPCWLARGFAVLEQAVSDHMTGRPPTAPRDGVTIACRQKPFDNAKARDQLGFAARPLSVTLQDTVAWLARGGVDGELASSDT